MAVRKFIIISSSWLVTNLNSLLSVSINVLKFAMDCCQRLNKHKTSFLARVLWRKEKIPNCWMSYHLLFLIIHLFVRKYLCVASAYILVRSLPYFIRSWRLPLHISSRKKAIFRHNDFDSIFLLGFLKPV